MPYGLSEVLKHDMVYAVEGERDVHTLRDLGFCATTNPGGSGGGHLWAEWTEIFRGKHVCHLLDNDGPGRKHVLLRARALAGVVAEQGIVEELPGVADGGDVTDWIAFGLQMRVRPGQRGPVGDEPSK